MKKVLIGVPIHEMKEYGIKRYIQSVKSIEWNNLFFYMVDNSENPQFYKRVAKYCQDINLQNYEIKRLEGMFDREDYEEERLGFSREAIRQKFFEGNFDWWFSLECDIIAPPQILKQLSKHFDGFDAIYHSYPMRGGIKIDQHLVNGTFYQEQDGIGCALFNKKVLEAHQFADGKNLIAPSDVDLINKIITSEPKAIKIHNIFRLEHLNGK